MEQIGRDLSVRYALEGSVRRVGETITVNAQLISTETAAHIWAGSQSEKVVRLHDYPDWTVVAPPDSGSIARIEIESLDFVGKGPAIAAVKAFRKEW